MSKTFPQKIDKIFDVSFSSIFLNRVFGCFSAMGVQKHYKNVLQKFVFTKKSSKIQNRFASRFVYRVFRRFSVRGEKNVIKKKSNKEVLFWPLTRPPPLRGFVRFWT
jgi:hypothetical protein